jgi:hypothetical protein
MEVRVNAQPAPSVEAGPSTSFPIGLTPVQQPLDFAGSTTIPNAVLNACADHLALSKFIVDFSRLCNNGVSTFAMNVSLADRLGISVGYFRRLLYLAVKRGLIERVKDPEVRARRFLRLIPPAFRGENAQVASVNLGAPPRDTMARALGSPWRAPLDHHGARPRITSNEAPTALLLNSITEEEITSTSTSHADVALALPLETPAPSVEQPTAPALEANCNQALSDPASRIESCASEPREVQSFGPAPEIAPESKPGPSREVPENWMDSLSDDQRDFYRGVFGTGPADLARAKAHYALKMGLKLPEASNSGALENEAHLQQPKTRAAPSPRSSARELRLRIEALRPETDESEIDLLVGVLTRIFNDFDDQTRACFKKYLREAASYRLKDFTPYDVASLLAASQKPGVKSRPNYFSGGLRRRHEEALTNSIAMNDPN